MTNTQDIREQIHTLIEHLEHTLPSQAPIRDFVHHNTLHGFQHLPFPEALASARRLTGASGYLPLERYRNYLQQGRICLDDLSAILIEECQIEPDAIFANTPNGPIRQCDLYLAVLTTPRHPVSSCQLTWQIEEGGALQRLRTDLPEAARTRLIKRIGEQGIENESALVADLWQACLEILQLEYQVTHPEELIDLAPNQAETLLNDLLDDVTEAQDTSNTAIELMHQMAHHRLAEKIDRLGKEHTMRDLLLSLTGEDLLEEIQPQLIRWLGSFLDQGVSSWQPNHPDDGFYAFWRDQAESDPDWQLKGFEIWKQQFELLENDSLETIISELHRMGLDRDRWIGYLERLALELPGWSGMVLWRHQHPHYEALPACVKMTDYFAVRLVLERLHAHHLCARHFNIEASLDMLRWYFRNQSDEFIVREALFEGDLPEYLASRAQRAIRTPEWKKAQADSPLWHHLAQLIWTWRLSSGASGDPYNGTVCSGAWPLFQLAQQLGCCGTDIRSLNSAQIATLFDALKSFDDDQMGYIWLRAYEKNYRDQILTALAQNWGRGAWPDRKDRPAAQLVFCMDDREEGIRRHLEEIDPEVETLGAAAHYNVPHNWLGLDDHKATPLAPVIPAPVIPVHTVCEHPDPAQTMIGEQHRKRHRLLQQGQQWLLQTTRHGLAVPGLLLALAAPLTLVVLMGKILMPGPFSRLQVWLRTSFEKRLVTRINFSAPNKSPKATQQAPRKGFTDIEQADRVETLLRAIGLTKGFSHLVAIIGHGSSNQNNPHASAYNCGACSGRFSGPNARLVASMANRDEVRAILAKREILIPDDCWFISAEHDTCDDSMVWYDSDLIPANLGQSFQKLEQSVHLACQYHAQERCRRFASAPPTPSPQKAYRHVTARAKDFSQARPELGHATNACAFFGRRSTSRGAFFDRRAFLISYDTSEDPEGKVLERHLLINGAVGAGISLEYYFSTVDNEHYGSGSKVTHNVTGFLGVMEGASSDLRTGLPQQMIEIHEAMRLLVVVEATTELLTQIYQRHPPIQELVGNEWIQLVSLNPNNGDIALFHPQQGWLPWQTDQKPLSKVSHSAAWYLGFSEPLQPALIETPAGDKDHA
jgi:uncharacterized protein YbcC (UPF0753/DUF2309 family)